jgi:hypothetical protein
MSPRYLVAVLTLALGTIAVGAGAQTSHSHTKASAASTAGPPPVITLERTRCKGQCAEYKLSLYADGLVTYDGRANSSKAGMWRATVSRQTISELVAQFARANFMTLQDNFPGGLSEDPVAITSFRQNDHVKTVTHDVGSPFSPESLTALEDMIDASVQSVNWSR